MLNFKEVLTEVRNKARTLHIDFNIQAPPGLIPLDHERAILFKASIERYEENKFRLWYISHDPHLMQKCNKHGSVIMCLEFDADTKRGRFVKSYEFNERYAMGNFLREIPVVKTWIDMSGFKLSNLIHLYLTNGVFRGIINRRETFSSDIAHLQQEQGLLKAA